MMRKSDEAMEMLFTIIGCWLAAMLSMMWAALITETLRAAKRKP
jgi:hypothetical protein